MTTQLTSRNGATMLTALIAVAVGLALLSAVTAQGLSTRTAAASLLILCLIVFAFGGVLFTGRAFLNWQIGETSNHLIWERGFVIGGILFTVLGLSLLEEMLHAAGDSFLARLGLVTYLSGAVVAITAETAYVAKRDWVYPQIVLYVVLAFLAQAAFGAAILQTGFIAAWVGWITILWNLMWFIGLLIFNPRNIYFPVLHHVAPLIIGIALLTQT